MVPCECYLPSALLVVKLSWITRGLLWITRDYWGLLGITGDYWGITGDY
jgi:hypothetical protein